MRLRALRLDKGRPQLDLVKAVILFLRQSVFLLGELLFIWQKRLLDKPESEASCALQMNCLIPALTSFLYILNLLYILSQNIQS